MIGQAKEVVEHSTTPYRKKLIKRIWTIAQKLYGHEKEKKVYDMIEFVFNRKRMRELTDEELREIYTVLIDMLSEKECPQASGEWKVIKAIQKKLGWSDEHLLNYIHKYARVSHPRFLEYRTARLVIAAMKKIQRRMG